MPTDRPTKLVFVGHVDHGKSTLVGRLLADLDALPDGKLDGIANMCQKRGMPFEWAFVLDALQAERDQGITIDVSQVFFNIEGRPFTILDAPGHHEFIKNMVTGAAQADTAVLLVDASEGVREQTRRHAYLLHLLGLRDIIVAITKMDLAGYSEQRFESIKADTLSYLASIGVSANAAPVIPIAARDGMNVAARADEMAWYQGPTLLEALKALAPDNPPIDKPLRFPIQDVYKFDERRILAGRIETGILKIGDELLFSPGNRRARISSIEAWNVPEKLTEAFAGQSVGITLDQQIFVERGAIASTVSQRPHLSNVFKGRIFWLASHSLHPGKRYKMKLATADYIVEVERIEKIIDVDELTHRDGDAVERNQIAEVIFRGRGLMALDPFDTHPGTGRFVLVEDHRIAGGGLIDLEGFEDLSQGAEPKSKNVSRIDHRIEMEDRWRTNGHKSGILWLTGLPGAGKSTLAIRLEEALFQKGMQAYVLDGNNIRQALSSDLGFSPADRQENIRRIGEMAQILARAGFIVITAFISPYRDHRDQARALSGNLFHEVYLDAPLEVCEAREPRGLYKRARQGEILDFTGVSAPYETPVAPELVVDTAQQDVDKSLKQLVAYAEQAFRIKD